jgi:DNA-binding XRE family transcriptional regulator
MPSTRNFRELQARLAARPDDEERSRRAKEELDRQVEAFERTLAQLRRARRLTQRTLARILGLSEAEVSQIEELADLYLWTLESYITAMGGQLELVGALIDDELVTLELGDLTGREA